MTLREAFWRQVDTLVSDPARMPEGRKQVQRALSRLGTRKNKNTYTAWFGSGPRPNVRLSQVEELAAALRVQPGALFVPDGEPLRPAPEQLELPFEPGDPKRANVQIEVEKERLILRRSAK